MRPVKAETPTTYFECDACTHEVGGYSKKDLLSEGWKFHDIGGGQFFVMCGDCQELYEARREANRAISTS